MLQILSYMSRPYYQFPQQRQLDSGRVHWICRSTCVASLTTFKLWTWDAVPACSFFFPFLPCHLWFPMYKLGISFIKMFLDKFFFLILPRMKLLGVICFGYSVFHFLVWATLNSLRIPDRPLTHDALPECKAVCVHHRCWLHETASCLISLFHWELFTVNIQRCFKHGNCILQPSRTYFFDNSLMDFLVFYTQRHRQTEDRFVCMHVHAHVRARTHTQRHLQFYLF